MCVVTQSVCRCRDRRNEANILFSFTFWTHTRTLPIMHRFFPNSAVREGGLILQRLRQNDRGRWASEGTWEHFDMYVTCKQMSCPERKRFRCRMYSDQAFSCLAYMKASTCTTSLLHTYIHAHFLLSISYIHTYRSAKTRKTWRTAGFRDWWIRSCINTSKNDGYSWSLPSSWLKNMPLRDDIFLVVCVR